MNGVGASYLMGLGVAKDPAKAFPWLKAAALAGQPNAMHSLGGMYLNGVGTAPDAAEAYRWLSLATGGYIKDRNQDPAKALSLLQAATKAKAAAAERMSPEERQAIDSENQSWKPQPGRPPAE
jgi:hypothetical protein